VRLSNRPATPASFRDGELALLLYNVVKGPELSIPMDPSSAPTGNTNFTLTHEHSGAPIEGKLLGDGVLAVFTSARQAIEAALACMKAGDDAGLPLHLGLH